MGRIQRPVVPVVSSSTDILTGRVCNAKRGSRPQFVTAAVKHQPFVVFTHRDFDVLKRHANIFLADPQKAADAYHNRRLEIVDGTARTCVLPDAIAPFPDEDEQ